MLPVAELVRFAETLDDAWHSPVADAAAARWDLERPVFVRSSASHVLVAGAGPGRPRVVLRMRPDRPDHAAVLERGARAAAAWHRAGAPFVAAVASTEGRLVECVDGYAVTALQVADGEPLDGSPVDHEAARAWGGAVARLHAAGREIEAPAVPTTEGLAIADGLDPDLADAAQEVRAGLEALPRDESVRGLLHGDPEADNVVRTADGLVLVDPDEVRVGWFASDVAFALRDWQDAQGRLDWADEVPAGFLEGYRAVRPLTDEQLATVPLLVRAAALEDLVALRHHLQELSDDRWPGWAVTLQGRLRERATDLRRIAGA